MPVTEARKMKHVLSIALAVTLATVVAGAFAWAQNESPIKTTKLTEQMWMLSTDQGEYTTNTIAFVGEDGLLLIDTQAEEDAEALKDEVENFGKGMPKFIINTHRHIEHVGGNAIFGEEPIVIAHELVPSKLRSGSFIFNEFPAATFPDITVADSMSLYFNGERIRIVALAGSHDDNEIIVHFTESKIVHLSSLVNGFNFPSVDKDGDVLKFAELVTKAIELLPQDVVIVSGHNDVGTWQDLHRYRDMLVKTTDTVRRSLDEGKDVETLQKEKVLDDWKEYAGSYVSLDEWIEYIATGLERKAQGGKEEPKETVFEPLYFVWKDKGAGSSVEYYHELRQDHEDQYAFGEFDLLVIGMKLLTRNLVQEAAVFLQASLREYPDSKYNYYTNYELADAHNRLGNKELAIGYCREALELKPEFEPASTLLEELE
jgi:glyoxylase-like metal-dependent hydrolase (beta-lactamase superfamily II)